MFIGRKNEINYLTSQYRNNESSLILIYGRRRVGKTALIEEFIKSKKYIYLLATQQDINIIIRNFSMEMAEFFHDDITYRNPLTNWDDLFKYLIKNLQNVDEKIIFALDEFTYLVAKDKSILSILQKYYDLYFKDMKIFIIITGSLIGIINDKILSYESPLYGRRTGNILLNEMNLWEIKDFFPYYSVQDLIKIYSITGGLPYYLSALKNKKFNDIISTVINKNSIFYNDAFFILKEELKEPSKYFSILNIISTGHNRIGEIASLLNTSSGEITQYLDNLIKLGIISKRKPFFSNESNKQSIYKINNNYFNFFFRYIFPYQNLIEIDNYNVLLNIIKNDFDFYTSKIFEDISRNILFKFGKNLTGDNITGIGTWWRKNKLENNGKNEEEIDIIALTEDKNIIVGEVKWRNKPLKIEVLYSLQNKSVFIKPYKYILFSKSGFDENLTKLSEIDKNIILVDLNKIGELFNSIPD